MATNYPGTLDGAPDDHGDVWDAVAALELQLGTNPKTALTSGDWIIPEGYGRGDPIIPAAGRAYANPIRIPATATINKFAVEITTAAAGSTLDVYRFTASSGQPGTEVALLGSADSGTTGTKIVTISSPASWTVGWHWVVARVVGGAPRFRSAEPTSMRLPVKFDPEQGPSMALMGGYQNNTWTTGNTFMTGAVPASGPYIALRVS